ncbi:unnamed protein product [Boreogadus saida]
MASCHVIDMSRDPCVSNDEEEVGCTGGLLNYPIMLQPSGPMSLQGSWLVLLLLAVCSPPPAHAVKAVMCPDKESECPDETTCCQLPDETWGCCPMAKAVCCEDRQHCCPEGTQCDLSHSRCVSAGLGSVPLLEKLPARRRTEVGSASCPGGKSRCPKGYTCCQLDTGVYGCCPHPKAVCCSDQLHCCPANTTCDMEHERCLSGEGEALPLATKISAAPNHDVVCPDSLTICHDQSTCCQLGNGSYGCCPMPNAMCCSDHLHCCPNGYTCDLVHSTCLSSDTHLPLLTYAPAKTSSAVAEVKGLLVPCNETMACADETTCCQTTAGEWACCPMPEAVCCQDHRHCCPHATVCNLAQSRCDPARGHAPSVPWLTKLPALSLSAHSFFSTAEEVATARDGAGASSLPWVRKTPALPRADPEEPSRDGLSPARVECDARTTCPRDTTCCFMKSSGLWGCCPLPKAVCCADGEHCCPIGYTCDARTASCAKPRAAAGLQRLPWFSKQRAVQRGMLGDVKCDNASSCASGTTCCKLDTGEWGCCPLVKAVCCDDHAHCCPQSYTCNMQSGTCEKQLRHQTPRSRPQSKVVRSMLRPSAVEEDVPCDDVGVFRCSKQETCCRASPTVWACCPSAQAVCCADSLHCCPAGASCDQGAGGCAPRGQPSRPAQRWDADPVPLGL